LVNVHRVSIRGGTRLYVCRDVALRKQAEAELARERELCEHVVNNAPLLIVGLRPDGTTEFINAAVTRATGYQPDELIGRNWWRVMYPGHEYAQVERLLADEENFRVHDYEMTLTTKDGRERTIAWNAANMLDARKRLTTIVGLGRDVTDRKRLEDDLRQAHKMEAIGRLAGGIAHDFNNLLTIILGNRDLIDDLSKGEEAVQEPLAELGDAALRAATLTRQLLAFSRREASSPQVVDLNDLITDFAPLVKRLIGEDIQVTLELAPQAAPVEIDPSQFEQILLNLAVNARDAMPDGGRLAIVTANVQFADAYESPSAQVAPGSYVELKVADSGVGMTPGVREHIFEPFYTTKEVGQGSGMGLATVYGAVKQFNGSIVVESEPGQGTTFRIYLPQADESQALRSPDMLAASLQEAPWTATILVVEDNAALRHMACKLLAAEGYRVLAADSGEQALELAAAAERPIDLVLTDVVMPMMGGAEVAERLTALQGRVKVIFMSGYTEQRIGDANLGPGDWSFIQKPFTRRRLLNEVSAALADAASAAAS
jgi:PAS domain S-box-containing protein